jgi:hypothetical protein
MAQQKQARDRFRVRSWLSLAYRDVTDQALHELNELATRRSCFASSRGARLPKWFNTSAAMPEARLKNASGRS